MNRKARRQVAKKTAAPVTTLLKLDLGCGKNKAQGFTGVDRRKFDGVDQVLDLAEPDGRIDKRDLPAAWTGLPTTFKSWPWKDESVAEVRCSHFVEHLIAPARVHFVNELWRILVPNGQCTIVVPNWSSMRAYGDMTHAWPPVSEMWLHYLKKEWRDQNAPDNDFYTCNFEPTWGYTPHPAIIGRNSEYQQNALLFWKEAGQDIIATLMKIGGGESDTKGKPA